MPAFLKSALLYQKPTIPMSSGMPYTFPSSRYACFATGSRVPDHALVRSVRSSTSPASACCFRTPPPQVWKMSGSFPEAVSAVIFDLYDSFSSVTILIFTPVCRASNCRASPAQTPFAGLVVLMCHHSRVVVPEDPPSEPPPQPPSAVIPRPAAAEAARKPLRDSADSPIVRSLG
jgi:hypothetical protein